VEGFHLAVDGEFHYAPFDHLGMTSGQVSAEIVRQLRAN